ncbi:MAG: triose-phosphate isomerase [Deltaproteobacteria bacterium]|nr:MAG: triose-phosphate isomerase [Deltaproteobacteria bacterium]
MTRIPLIAGNWKLNLGPSQARALGAELAQALADRRDTEVAIFPTALSIPAVLGAVKGSGITVGVQEIHDKDTGAYTGTNSAHFAREAGCTWALIGHSERRQLFAETDEAVGRKARAALQAGLLPMVCIGETLEQRDAGQVHAVVTRQLSAALGTLRPDEAVTVAIAYEPIWAIGTGRTASPEQAQEVHAALRAWLRDRYPAFVAEQTRILYGGSVKPANAAELLGQPDIDGALVGGASLKADSFRAIVQAASA